MVVHGELCLWFSQIARFFDYQYLWKKSVDTLDFLHGDSHQGKVGFETAGFGWVWPVVFYPMRYQDSFISILGKIQLIS